MITLVYADTGDWVAVYRDGKLLDQGHSFSETRILELLGIEYAAIYEVNVEATGFRFPPSLEEVTSA